ncbi:MAG: hypothetical protein KDB27_02430 [Planctomycetales bacterium]|nr:hypothetical protein [Planctomycetales bacterium]
MSRNRLFVLGVVVLLMGLHFQVVDSFQLNERATAFWNKRFDKQAVQQVADPLDTYEVSTGDWFDNPPAPTAPTKRTITPPDWLAWSLISVGSVLILTCPCFR